MSQEQKYIKDQKLSESVTKTKVSHGKIETAIRVRNANSKQELDLELERLHILNELDKSTVSSEMIIPKELRFFQQLILIVRHLNLKTTSEILLACRKLGYSGTLTQKQIKQNLFYHKIYFK